jgi:hypothetical protein
MIYNFFPPWGCVCCVFGLVWTLYRKKVYKAKRSYIHIMIVMEKALSTQLLGNIEPIIVANGYKFASVPSEEFISKYSSIEVVPDHLESRVFTSGIGPIIGPNIYYYYCNHLGELNHEDYLSSISHLLICEEARDAGVHCLAYLAATCGTCYHINNYLPKAISAPNLRLSLNNYRKHLRHCKHTSKYISSLFQKQINKRVLKENHDSNKQRRVDN